MTRSEYQELTEFLGKKFDAIDRRFDGNDQRFDGIDQRFDRIEGRLAKVEVGLEENRHQTQIVAEGVTAIGQKLDRFKEEVTEEFRAVRGEMAEGFRAQGERIDGLGRRMDRSLHPKRI